MYSNFYCLLVFRLIFYERWYFFHISTDKQKSVGNKKFGNVYKLNVNIYFECIKNVYIYCSIDKIWALTSIILITLFAPTFVSIFNIDMQKQKNAFTRNCFFIYKKKNGKFLSVERILHNHQIRIFNEFYLLIWRSFKSEWKDEAISCNQSKVIRWRV